MFLPDGDVGEMPGAALTHSTELKRLIGIASSSSAPKRVAEAGVSSVEARARSVHDNRVRQRCQREDRRSLDSGPCPNADVGVPIRAKSLQDDVEPGPRRHARKPQLPPLVGLRRQRTANQRRRAKPDPRTRECAALFVLDRADERSGQPLRARGARDQECGATDHQTQELPIHVVDARRR